MLTILECNNCAIKIKYKLSEHFSGYLFQITNIYYVATKVEIRRRMDQPNSRRADGISFEGL